MSPNESSQDALLPAAANSSGSIGAEAKKSAMADADSSAKKSDSKPKPEPKPQVCSWHEWSKEWRVCCITFICSMAMDSDNPVLNITRRNRTIIACMALYEDDYCRKFWTCRRVMEPQGMSRTLLPRLPRRDVRVDIRFALGRYPWPSYFPTPTGRTRSSCYWGL